MVVAVNETVVILRVLRQGIITDNFVLLAMLLMWMQPAWRCKWLSHLCTYQRGKRHKRCR